MSRKKLTAKQHAFYKFLDKYVREQGAVAKVDGQEL